MRVSRAKKEDRRKFIPNPSSNGSCNELVIKDYGCQQHISSSSQKVNHMANRPQKALHDDEMETSELHRSVWTTP